MGNKKDLFKNHLENEKENLKNRLLDILEDNLEEFSSRTLFNIAQNLKEIETIQDFIESDDFKHLEQKNIKIYFKEEK